MGFENMKSKEEMFLELIDDLYTGEYSVEITLEGRFKKIEFFNSKGEWFIDYHQEIKLVYISYNRIWSVFEKEYNMKYDEVKRFMKEMLLTRLKIKETTYILQTKVKGGKS